MEVLSAFCPILTPVKHLKFVHLSEFLKTSCCKSAYFMTGTSIAKLNWGQIFGSSRNFLKWFIFRSLQQIAKIWIPTQFWDHSDLNDLNICNPLTANTTSRPRCIPWYLKIVLELDSGILSIGCFFHNCGFCRNRGVICQTSVTNTFAGEENVIKLMFRKC